MNRFFSLFNNLRENLKTRYGLDIWSVCCLVAAFLCATVHRYTGRNLFRLLALLFIAAALFLVLRKKPDVFSGLAGYFKGVFHRVKKRVRNSVESRRARRRDTEHRYFRCPQCSRMLRVPRGKGTVEISCTCGRTFRRRT